MSNTDLNEFLDNLSDRLIIIEKNEKVETGYEILVGDKKFEGNLDTFDNLMVLLNYIKKMDPDNKQLEGMFKHNIKEKAAKIESIAKSLSKQKVAEILSSHEGKGLTGDEKKLFDFASQAEDFLFNKFYGKELAPAGTRGSSDIKTNFTRMLNIFPIKITIRGKDRLGIVRGPEGIITWQGINIDDQKSKIMIDGITLNRVPLIKDGDKYKIEQTTKIKNLINDYNLKFFDSEKVSKKILAKIVSIAQQNSKYKKMSDEKVIDKLKAVGGIRPWIISSVDFWKTIKSFF